MRSVVRGRQRRTRRDRGGRSRRGRRRRCDRPGRRRHERNNGLDRLRRNNGRALNWSCRSGRLRANWRRNESWRGRLRRRNRCLGRRPRWRHRSLRDGNWRWRSCRTHRSGRRKWNSGFRGSAGLGQCNRRLERTDGLGRLQRYDIRLRRRCGWSRLRRSDRFVRIESNNFRRLRFCRFRHRRRDRRGLFAIRRFERRGSEGHLGLATERSLDVRRNGNVLLRRTAWEKSGIETRENFVQRNLDHHAVAVAFGGERAGRTHLAQFAEADFHRTLRDLRNDFLCRKTDLDPARVRHAQELHEFRRQFGNERFKRNGNLRRRVSGKWSRG